MARGYSIATWTTQQPHASACQANRWWDCADRKTDVQDEIAELTLVYALFQGGCQVLYRASCALLDQSFA